MMEDNNPAPVIQDNLCHRICNKICSNKIQTLVYTAMIIVLAHYVYLLRQPKIVIIKPENYETDRFTHEKSSKNKEEHPKLDPEKSENEKLPEENIENEKEEKKETEKEKPKLKDPEKTKQEDHHESDKTIADLKLDREKLENEKLKKEEKKETEKEKPKIKNSEKIKPEEHHKLDKIIVGIDFGSSESGYSFLETNDPKDIEDGETYSSEIVLKNGHVKEIGRHSYETFKTSDNGLYFENMKIYLDPKRATDENMDDLEIEAIYPKGKKIKLKIVIKEFLRFISDKAVEKLDKKYSNKKKYKKDEIKWVVTVPAIWSESGKQFMIRCAKEAGMNDIHIALEPEAASLEMYYDNALGEELKQNGKKFILIDAGGYTIDITINEIINKNNNIYLKQLSPPSGGPFGSKLINSEIIKIIEEIFGELKFNDSRDRKNLFVDIEGMKIGYCKNKQDSKNLIIRHYQSIWLCYSKCSIKTKYGDIEYDRNNVYLSRNIIDQIISNQVNKIINNIDLALNTIKIPIDEVILVGGFCNCEIVIDTITNKFPGITFQLSNKEKSVMRGASLFGLNPNQIISRISPFTIGTKAYEPRKNETECQNPKEGLCLYFFDFVHKGEVIQNNAIRNFFFGPVYKNQTGYYFPLYRTNRIKPIYINESEKFAEFTLQASDTKIEKEKRMAKITVQFSSCITIFAENINTGEKINISANYYNRND